MGWLSPGKLCVKTSVLFPSLEPGPLSPGWSGCHGPHGSCKCCDGHEDQDLPGGCLCPQHCRLGASSTGPGGSASPAVGVLRSSDACGCLGSVLWMGGASEDFKASPGGDHSGEGSSRLRAPEIDLLSQ